MGRLTDGFRDIIELTWAELVELEKSKTATNFDSIVTGIARAAAKSNLKAIQMALDRLDGKIATEVEVEYPKFYTLYPNATKTADDPAIIDDTLEDGVLTVPARDDVDLDHTDEEELPTGSLRAVLERLLDEPKKTVDNLLLTAKEVDKGNLKAGNPKVKSVIMAGLMKMVHDGRTSAIFEILEQIDGKVKDKFKVLGDDVFIYNYSKIAPAGAEKNDEGIYQIAADNTTNAWVARLEAQTNKRR